MKARFDLIPAHSLRAVAEALTKGADKHSHGERETVLRAIEQANENTESLLMESLLRHLNADQCGERMDAEGFSHLAAVAARVLMILEVRRRRER